MVLLLLAYSLRTKATRVRTFENSWSKKQVDKEYHFVRFWQFSNSEIETLINTYDNIAST